MSSPFEEAARSYLADLGARLGHPGPARDEEVRRLADLVEGAVREERQACAAVGDEFATLCGSWAAQEIAARIRARG